MTNDIEAVREEMAARARPFADAEGLADLVERFAGRRVVCLGEATHGTSEFYRARAAITERLVRDHGFRIVAIEGDWPDAAAWNATIGGHPAPRGPEEPFSRFPRWMWRNAEARDLLERLRSFNRARPDDDQAGFYGLDMYSLCASIDAVLDYLEMSSPEPARDAQGRVLVDAVSAQTMIEALQQVAELNHVPARKRSWRHGSIAWRQRNLRALVGLPVEDLPIDRQMQWIKAAALALLVVTAAGFALLAG